MIRFHLRAMSACCCFTFALAVSSTFSPGVADAQSPASALAPANLHKPRPKAPFDLTGTWSVDMRKGFRAGLYGPPYPKPCLDIRTKPADLVAAALVLQSGSQ